MTARTQSPLERIPSMGRRALGAMMFGGLMGGFLTCPGTPAHQAFSLLVGAPVLVIMAPVVVHPMAPKWEWMGRPIDRLAYIWLSRLGFVIMLYVYVKMTIQLAHTLLTS